MTSNSNYDEWESELVCPTNDKVFIIFLQIKNGRQFKDKTRECALPSFHYAHFFVIKLYFHSVCVLVWWDSCTLSFVGKCSICIRVSWCHMSSVCEEKVM